MAKEEQPSSTDDSGTRFRLLYDLGCAFSARIEVEDLFPFIFARLAPIFEAQYFRRSLEDNGRNVSKTARILGLSRVVLQKTMKEYSLRDE